MVHATSDTVVCATGCVCGDDNCGWTWATYPDEERGLVRITTHPSVPKAGHDAIALALAIASDDWLV